MQKKVKEQPKWMITFADLLSLILTFFVLIYSMSVLEKRQWEVVSESMTQRLGSKVIPSKEKPTEEKSIPNITRPNASNLSYLENIINTKLLDLPGLRKILSVQRLEDRILLSVIGKEVFVGGGTVLTKNGDLIIFLLAEAVSGIGNKIEIYGNALPEPKPTREYPSNWELSLGRALKLSKTLSKEGYRYNIDSFGRAAPADDELTLLSEEERSVFLRRVDIVIREFPADG